MPMHTQEMPFQIVIPRKTPLTTLHRTNDIPSRAFVSRPNNLINQINYLDFPFPFLRRSRLRMNQLMPLQNLFKPKRLPTPFKPTNKRLFMLMRNPHMILQSKQLPSTPPHAANSYLCISFRTPLILTKKLLPLLKRRTMCTEMMQQNILTRKLHVTCKTPRFMFLPTMPLKIQKKNKRFRTVVAKVPFRMAFLEVEVEFGW